MTKKSREEFSKAFVRGVSFSLAAYSLYSLRTSAAESNVPKTPENTGVAKPKPLSDGTKGAFVVGATTVYGAASQSRDFYLGLVCAFLLVIDKTNNKLLVLESRF